MTLLFISSSDSVSDSLSGNRSRQAVAHVTEIKIVTINYYKTIINLCEFFCVCFH